jgi:hypothetical protein
VTSNPSIFEKAIGEGVEYAPALAKLRQEKPKSTNFDLYEALAVKDIQTACDVMKPVYEASKARDGYVSLEVTMVKGERATDILDEARRLWVAVGRPNVMIKVPGNGRRHRRVRSADRGRRERQRHALVRGGHVRQGREGLRRRSRETRQEESSLAACRERRELLRQPHRLRHRQGARRADREPR